ncbi:HDIG domain-containing metalloprotein [Clostridium sp.]|uniref:HDIG domain-containing metalloprotein n=1 Tax=Clostridium sp. TaxID=1506 RepID=UPI0032180667
MNYFEEFNKHLIEDSKPSIYFNNLVKTNSYPNEHPYDKILKLKEIEQNPKYHPEGDVWMHTMMVVDEAAKRRSQSKNPKGFMWAALLHDIGKLTTTRIRRGWITSYDHDKVGEKMAQEFLTYLNLDKDQEFYNYVLKLVRLHMQILFIIKNNEFADFNLVVKSGCIEDIGLLGICDRLGRGPKSEEDIKKEEGNIEIFLERCNNYIKQRERMAKQYNMPEK